MVDGYYRCELSLNYPEKGISCNRYGILYMYQEDGQLKGNMFPTYYWLPAAFRRGTVNENNFSFSVFFSSPCQQFELIVEGQVNGDTVTGTARNAAGFEGPYILKGTRIPESQCNNISFVK